MESGHVNYYADHAEIDYADHERSIERTMKIMHGCNRVRSSSAECRSKQAEQVMNVGGVPLEYTDREKWQYNASNGKKQSWESQRRTASPAAPASSNRLQLVEQHRQHSTASSNQAQPSAASPVQAGDRECVGQHEITTTEVLMPLKGFQFFSKMFELFSGRCRWRRLTATIKGLFSQNCLTCKCQPFKVDPAASQYFCEQVANTLANIPMSPLT